MSTDPEIRESARRHFTEASETYKAFASELRSLDRKFLIFGSPLLVFWELF